MPFPCGGALHGKLAEEPVRVDTMSKRLHALSDRSAPQIHPISGGADQFASPSAVLHLIGRATGHLSAKRRPSDAVRRSGVAAVSAIAEIVREVEIQFGSEPWTVEIPHDLSEISRRAGGSTAEMEEALALLQDTGCVISVASGGERRLRLSEDLFGEHPTLARIHWEAARTLLERVGGSQMPALAVLREIGLWSGNRTQGDTGPWVEVSLPRLMDSTLFRRTAVSKALAELDRGGLIGRALRAGREHACRLLPAAFGTGDLAEPAQEAPPGPAVMPLAPDAPSPQAIPVQNGDAPAVTLRFGGSEVRIHGGVTCDVRPGPDGVPVLEIRPTLA